MAARKNIAVFTGVALAATASAADWLQFGYDEQHSGVNPFETILGQGNVAGLIPLYRVTLPERMDSAPVYITGVSTPSGLRNILFVETVAGRLLAIDAASGAVVWSQSNPLPYGFTSTSPAIDPQRQYVYSYGGDGCIHKYRVGDGTEILDGAWPEVVTLKPIQEKVDSALTIATAANGVSYLYLSTASSGDAGDYQGHLTTIDLASGLQRVFNVMCSDLPFHFLLNGTPGINDCQTRQGGIWGRPSSVYDPSTDRIFITTGNGDFNGNMGGFNWGDSVLALSPNGGASSTGFPLDSYTPADYGYLDSGDQDLGSTSLAVLPFQPLSAMPHLGVQGGKDRVLRLLDLSNLSGQGLPGFTGGELQVIQADGSVLPQPAVWADTNGDGSVWIFAAFAPGALRQPLGFGIEAFQLIIDSAGMPSLAKRWSGLGASSIVVANDVLYARNFGDFRAMDPRTGIVLWTSEYLPGLHWQSPIVVDGRVYLGDEQAQLWAFSLDQIYRDGFD